MSASWTAPSTRPTGFVVTSSIYNNEIINNLLAIMGQLDLTRTITAANTDLAAPTAANEIWYIQSTGGSLRSIGVPPAGTGSRILLRNAGSGAFSILYNTGGGTGKPIYLVQNTTRYILVGESIELVYDATYATWVPVGTYLKNHTSKGTASGTFGAGAWAVFSVGVDDFVNYGSSYGFGSTGQFWTAPYAGRFIATYTAFWSGATGGGNCSIEIDHYDSTGVTLKESLAADYNDVLNGTCGCAGIANMIAGDRLYFRGTNAATGAAGTLSVHAAITDAPSS